MKITILGSGAYGLALATMASINNHDITVWSRNEVELKELELNHTNKRVLPNYILPNGIEYTNNLKKAVKNSDLIIFAVPAGAVCEVSEKLKKYYKNQAICIASKGIEQDTCLFVDDVLKKHIDTSKIAVISGPSFAIDIVKLIPIGLSLGSKDENVRKIVKDALENQYMIFEECDDIIGIEVCGSVKNIIAIAAGIIDGLGLPESTQAMFITKALNDMKELIVALGGNNDTILTYAGFGDLLLTATSIKSRNFRFGKMLGEGQPKEIIDNYVTNTTIEGLYTLKSIYKLLNNKNVSIPTIDLIYDIVFNGKDVIELQNILTNKQKTLKKSKY